MTSLQERYDVAQQTLLDGNQEKAEILFDQLLQEEPDSQLHARILNDLGVSAMLSGQESVAMTRFQNSLERVPDLSTARENLCRAERAHRRHIRIAVVSFLFNWPSTGGGIIHTVELVQFLKKAGFHVELFHPRFEPWGIGRRDATCPVPATALNFEEPAWHAESIKARFRETVAKFDPHHVIITDCWNFKPHLAEALSQYPVYLRMQAQECLCPLNNLGLLMDSPEEIRQCAENQLSSPQACGSCLKSRGDQAGSLHFAERQLSGVGTAEYQALLAKAFRESQCVLALNPAVASELEPHCDRVQVVTWGMNSERFPWPRPETPDRLTPENGKTRIVFAGLLDEPIKGFRVIHGACRQLAKERDDFELIVTHDPAGQIDDFTRSVGWQTQQSLPDVYRDCDICAVPTIAQDGLSRTSVEAMACGLPVIASRIGGLPFTVEEVVTGRLCEPGDVGDWTAKLSSLLDDPDQCRQMGMAGRQVFEDRFVWEQVIEESYVPLFAEVKQEVSR